MARKIPSRGIEKGIEVLPKSKTGIEGAPETKIDIVVEEPEKGGEASEQERNRSEEEKLEEVYGRIEKITRGDSAIVRPQIPQEYKALVEGKVEKLKQRMRWRGPAILLGKPTATNYDSHVTNYSTQTEIIELPNGEKIFAVYNYPSSWFHRSVSDRLNKFVAGVRMYKVRSRRWKGRFESRTQIPTIENDDPNVVLMPFIPNINLRDLFSYKDKIKDFGECDFAKDYTPEDLLGVLEKVAVKIKELHNKGIGWGETNLGNMIIDNQQQVHICDPESEYNADVSFVEQQARDLMLFIVSASGAMRKSDVDAATVVERVMSAYGEANPEVLEKLSEVSRKKTGLFKRIFFPGVMGFLGVRSFKEYKTIKEEIVKYLEKNR